MRFEAIWVTGLALNDELGFGTRKISKEKSDPFLGKPSDNYNEHVPFKGLIPSGLIRPEPFTSHEKKNPFLRDGIVG